jgi:DNA-directed RNA polymerase specialized sigma24 family protein
MKLEGSYAHMQAFNALILAYQDEAFTLARYLLEDDERASEIVQDACRETYQASCAQQTPVRSEILRRVLRACQAQAGRTNGASAAPRLNLALLPIDQRALVVLVDVLRLDYNEAAQVLRKSTPFVRQKLAQGRARLACLPGSHSSLFP